MPSPTEITPTQLSRLIGTPSAPVIIDVRIDEDFDADPQILPTAFRCAHGNIESCIDKIQHRKAVIYCQKGKKLSQGCVAILRNFGIDAEYLQGGHFAWRDQGGMMIPAAKLTLTMEHGVSTWVTRHRPKIDRIACPWLIKRFIDPYARFMFVAPAEVKNVAEKFNATPFDIEDAYFSHKGDQCSFDTFIEEFDLQSEPLLHLAKIIRGADTNQLELTPQSSGLLAASLGFSRMYKDDLLQLEASLGLYDAFYRWCRDATDETHDWP